MPNINEKTYHVSLNIGITNQGDLGLFKHSRLSKVVDKNMQ